MIKAQYHHIINSELAKAIGRIGVLYGGLSDEREVSLWSGQAVYDALIKVGLSAKLIDVSRDFINIAIKRQFDYAFIILHGLGGEDGTIQAILDWLGIPYTGSGVQASSIAIDKIRSKQLWAANGLPVLPQVVLDDNFDADVVISKIGFPMAVKPVFGGSSNGTFKVVNHKQLLQSYRKASKYKSLIMAESWIEGKEFTGTIIGDKVFPLICIKVKNGIYDFARKYITGADEYKCPCGLSDKDEVNLQALILKAAKVIGVCDWCRVDVMIDKNDQAWLIEINTIPGMTTSSLVPRATQQGGLNFEETVLTILKTSWDNYHA